MFSAIFRPDFIFKFKSYNAPADVGLFTFLNMLVRIYCYRYAYQRVKADTKLQVPSLLTLLV
jgi:hypothetical protein